MMNENGTPGTDGRDRPRDPAEHVSDAEFAGSVTKTLPAEAAREVERHLAQCEECCERFSHFFEAEEQFLRDYPMPLPGRGEVSAGTNVTDLVPRRPLRVAAEDRNSAPPPPSSGRRKPLRGSSADGRLSWSVSSRDGGLMLVVRATDRALAGAPLRVTLNHLPLGRTEPKNPRLEPEASDPWLRAEVVIFGDELRALAPRIAPQEPWILRVEL